MSPTKEFKSANSGMSHWLSSRKDEQIGKWVAATLLEIGEVKVRPEAVSAIRELYLIIVVGFVVEERQNQNQSKCFAFQYFLPTYNQELNRLRLD